MPLIENLNTTGMLAMSLKVAQPATDKVVIVQCVIDGKLYTCGARYRNGRWIGEEAGEDLTDGLLSSEMAVWSESFLFPESACHTLENTR